MELSATLDETVQSDLMTPLESDLCSKCKARERRAADQRYCMDCHAEVQREWRSENAGRTRYLRGVEAFRARAAREFEFLGITELSGKKAAEIIRSLALD